MRRSIMDKKIKSQLLAVRSTALTNMFDLAAVSRIAKVLGYRELVDFIKKDRKAYCEFILTGKE
jgi:hypothetical protein